MQGGVMLLQKSRKEIDFGEDMSGIWRGSVGAKKSMRAWPRIQERSIVQDSSCVLAFVLGTLKSNFSMTNLVIAVNRGDIAIDKGLVPERGMSHLARASCKSLTLP